MTGVGLAIVCLVPHAFLSNELSVVFAAVLMGVIAGVYFGFAVVSGSNQQQLIEFNVASLFGIAALLGVAVSTWFLPAAYIGHALWDLAHHNKSKLGLVAIPQWYIPWCVIIDVIIAVGLVVIWRSSGVL